MARYTPPMYNKVRPKVAPKPRAVAQPVAVPEVEKAAPKKVTAKKAAPKKAATKKPVSKKVTAKKAAPKKAAAKKPKTAKKKTAAKKPKLIKWDEDMTQKMLYRLAKDAGIEVRSKDWKHEIISEIKKFNKKASK